MRVYVGASFRELAQLKSYLLKYRGEKEQLRLQIQTQGTVQMVTNTDKQAKSVFQRYFQMYLEEWSTMRDKSHTKNLTPANLR